MHAEQQVNDQMESSNELFVGWIFRHPHHDGWHLHVGMGGVGWTKPDTEPCTHAYTMHGIDVPLCVHK